MPKQLPSHARVVVIGGGVVGCSIAYHLTKLGWKEVVLLERKKLTSGTTWHAAGLIGQLRATLNMTRLAQYTAGLYAGLEEETGQATGWKQRGSIAIATTAARFEELLRGASMAKTFGLEVHEIGPGEIKRHWPLLEVSDVVGGVFLPKDGQTNPVDTTVALAKGATMRGAQVFEETKVDAIRSERGRVVGVATERGEIKAEHVVIATGMWSRAFGRSCGVNIPLQACEHFYVVTEDFPELTATLPVLRDPDHCAYFKEDAGKLLFGAFEPKAKPWAIDGIPEGFEFGELAEDFDHFQPILEAAMRRLPALERVGIRKFFNGPESFTPDVRYMLGEAPELPGLFVAAGFNSTGIQSAGGAGKVLAEWIVGGHPPMDLWDVRHPAHAALPGQQALSCRARLRIARSALCHALALSPVRDRARRAADPALRAAQGAGRLFRRDRRVGARQLVRARRRRAQVRVQLRPAELVRPCRGRAQGGARGLWPSSISRASRNSWSRDATRRPCSSASPRTTWRSSRAASSIPNGSTSAAASRRTSP